MSNSLNIEVVDLGVMAYEPCLELQHQYHQKAVAGDPSTYLLLVQHPPVLTFGKNADAKFMLFAQDELKRQGIDVVHTDRGGEVTAHEPGQLVVYPVLRLADYGLSARSYVNLLENSVIRLLETYGVKAHTDPQHPGVWVGAEKICALGVRIKQRATMHGLALNLVNDLGLFQKIVPCGIVGRGVTSLKRQTEKGEDEIGVKPVAERLVRELANGLRRLQEMERSPSKRPSP